MFERARALLAVTLSVSAVAARPDRGVSQVQQTISIALQRDAVIDAPYRTFSVGERLLVNVSPNALRAAGGATNIRARVIRATPEALLALAAGLSPNDCVMLPAALFRVREADGGIIFDVSFSVEWLGVSLDGVPRDQVYLIVFEASSTGADPLRLRSGDLTRYLASAFPIIVAAPMQMTNSAIARLITYHRTSALPAPPAPVECHRLAALDPNTSRFGGVRCNM